MTKRQRFVITSILLSLGFVGISSGYLNIEGQNRFLSVFGLSILTLILFIWSLREGLGRNLTLLVLILPVLYTIGVGVFWFLIPSHILAKIPVVVLYGLGIYALCLTSNIYTVASVRTIALLRAARGVGFVLTLLTFFLIFDAILSIRINLVLQFIFVFLVSFPLFMQGFWSIPLSTTMNRKLAGITFVSSLATAQVALSLYFWPVTVVVGSLFLTALCYVLLGLGQAYLEGKLFKQTIREYLLLGALVFIGMLIVTTWGA